MRTTTRFRIPKTLVVWVAVAATLGFGGYAVAAASDPAPAAEPPVAACLRFYDRMAQAHWHYAVAQLKAQADDLPDAITELKHAIRDDPSVAALWVGPSRHPTRRWTASHHP